MKLIHGLLPVALVLSLLGGLPGALARKAPKPPPEPKFSRAELMVINLNRGPKSCGFFLSETLRQTRQAIKDLDRARRQLEQVDHEYAKFKGRPDDHFFGSSVEGLSQAQESAAKLEKQLDETLDELRSSIKQSLIAQ